MWFFHDCKCLSHERSEYDDPDEWKEDILLSYQMIFLVTAVSFLALILKNLHWYARSIFLLSCIKTSFTHVKRHEKLPLIKGGNYASRGLPYCLPKFTQYFSSQLWGNWLILVRGRETYFFSPRGERKAKECAAGKGQLRCLKIEAKSSHFRVGAMGRNL